MWSGVQATLNVAAPTFVSDVKKNYNPSQNSRDTNAIARRIEHLPSPIPPRCSVDVMYSSFNLTQSTLLGGEGDSRNSPL